MSRRTSVPRSAFSAVTATLLAAAGLVSFAFGQDACAPTRDLTSIPMVQGAAERSPFVSERVVVQGVVTATFLGRDQLGGVFLQDPFGDDDPATSDAIFVRLRAADLAAAGEPRPGDVMRVSGTVLERNAMTTLDRLVFVQRCGSGELPAATPVTLPLRGADAWERLEGMRVRAPSALSVTEVYELGRYGRLALADVPLSVASQLPPGTVTEPGNEPVWRSIELDDGYGDENRDPPAYLHADGLPPRVGDLVTGVEAVVVSEGLGAYRLDPLAAPTLVRANPRPLAPPPVGVEAGAPDGWRVAGLNAFNLFTSIPGRGARSPIEIERQREKLVAALVGLDADVVGLMEVENDGGRTLADLVAALNERFGEERYAAVPYPDGPLGTDAITQALIYRRDRVEPLQVFTDASAIHDRPPLAATFQDLVSGETVSVIVVHFKSKGSCPAAGDVDTGYGCWNLRRSAQMSATLAFGQRIADATGDPDVLVVGDLNAYAAEPPLRIARLANWHDLGGSLPTTERYSYVYFGERGTLDYALASPSLARQVRGFAYWHINADEAPLLNYFTTYNPPSAYRPDAFRSSDHDPVLVGIGFR
jgi:uncharacterized protein